MGRNILYYARSNEPPVHERKRKSVFFPNFAFLVCNRAQKRGRFFLFNIITFRGRIISYVREILKKVFKTANATENI